MVQIIYLNGIIKKIYQKLKKNIYFKIIFLNIMKGGSNI